MSMLEFRQAAARQAGYTIRPLQRADANAIEWEGEFTHFRRIYARAFERAEAGHAALWGIDDEQGVLVGQVFVLLYNETDTEAADGAERAFIHSFRIRPAHRNRGLGAWLLGFAEADLRARNFRWVSLNVASDNPGAIRLYERLGYRRQHAIAGYWSFVDHLGTQRSLHEPGWRMGKKISKEEV